MVHGILEALEKVDNVNTYFLYAHRAFSLPFDNPRWHRRFHLSFSRIPGTIWLQTGASRIIQRDRLDLFLGTAHVLPLGLPSTVRKLLIVHDLVWKLFPETATIYNRLVQRLFSKRSIETADVIIAVSESTKRNLQELLGLEAKKIKVIHNGISPIFHPQGAGNAAKYTAGKYGVSPNYVCAVGTLEPRKNLVRLIEAFAILKRRDGCPPQLVIAGPRGWGNLQLEKKAEKAGLTGGDVIFLGFVPDQDLPLLYSGAAVFVFPSLYEGFGLPLLEAMACGTPVVCSNRSSLPEIGVDAVLYVNPESAEEIAFAIEKILGDSILRESLIQRGLKRAGEFSWDSCARSFLSVFEEVARTAPLPPAD